MDIIDLCFDEENATIVAPEDPLGTIASEEATTNNEPEQNIQIADVPSFSTVENSLETDNATEISPAKRSNRRKTTHQPINTDDQLEFTYINLGNTDDEFIDVSELAIKRNVPHMKIENSNEISLSTDDIMNGIKKKPNPNSDLMKRVAFLRVSVEFTLKKLGFRTFPFSRNCNLQNLQNQYLRDKRLKKKMGKK